MVTLDPCLLATPGHLKDTFNSYAMFGVKRGNLPNGEEVAIHFPRFVKLFEDCQLVHGHITLEYLRAVFDETMKSNNDDGSWVGSPRNQSTSQARTRHLSRSSYSSKNLLGQVTTKLGPDFSKPPSTAAIPTTTKSPFTGVEYMGWESFIWAFFKLARCQGLTLDQMISNALTNHPHGTIPRAMSHIIEPTLMDPADLAQEFKHVFEHYQAEGSMETLRFGSLCNC